MMAPGAGGFIAAQIEIDDKDIAEG